jgi:hypothetical protein
MVGSGVFFVSTFFAAAARTTVLDARLFYGINNIALQRSVSLEREQKSKGETSTRRKKKKDYCLEKKKTADFSLPSSLNSPRAKTL